MATINFTKADLPSGDDKRVDVITWTDLAGSTSDVGSPYTSYLRPDKTIQILDGSSGFNGDTLVIQGSNDGTNWETLSDADGNACSFTDVDMVFVRESPRFLRPSISGGTGDVTVILCAANMGRDW